MSPLTYSISLTAIAFLVGVGVLPVFARFSNKEKLTLAKRKIRAALYGFRLFGDEPRMVFRAQGQLLAWNARYIGLMLRPVAVLIIPIAILLWGMDAVYGHRAFHVGETAIVSARLAPDVNLNDTMPKLTGQGVAVETLPVRIPQEHRVLWGVQPTAAGRGELSLAVPDAENSSQPDEPVASNAAPGTAAGPVQKNMQVGPGLHELSEQRVASHFGWLFSPWEPRLPANGPVRSIGFQYPGAEFHLFGLAMPWIVWFLIVSWVTAFALRKRFGVVL
jgi:hypothetical protein